MAPEPEASDIRSGFHMPRLGIGFAMARSRMSRSVLLVEPDDPSARLWRAILEPDGWRVLHSPDGDHACELLRGVRPDIVAIDVIVATRAVELVHRIRDLVGDLPIVAMTSYRAPDLDDRLIAAGFSSCIAMPVDVTTFSAQLRAHLGDLP
jgi:OmpR-family two-component system manganese-sensing response regulator